MMDSRTLFNVGIRQRTPLLDIATRDVVWLAPDDSAGEAARLMTAKQISSILVADEEARPLGIVTERNVLLAMHAGLAPETALREVMAAPVITVPGSMACLDAYQICQRDNIRHLVIVDDDGRLAGVASETDFRLHMDLSMLAAGQRQIGGVMTRQVLGLPPQSSLRDVLNLMEFRRDTCVVAVENERPVGIVTGRDIVRLYAHRQDASLMLAQVMNSPVLTIRHDDSINKAAGLMFDNRVRHLAVVDDAGCLVGLVSEHDLTNILAGGLMRERQSMEGGFLRAMMDTLPDLVWLKDPEGAYLACNKRFGQFFGAGEKDIVGRFDSDFMDKPMAESFRELDRDVMAKGESVTHEERLTFATDNYSGSFEIVRTPMRDRRGRLVGVLGIARDITGRKREELERRADHEKLRSLYELSPMGIALTDMRGHYIEFNDAFRDICGYSREELNRLDCWALTPKEYTDKDAEQLASLRTRGRYGPYEKEYLRKDGSRIPLRLNGVQIRGSDGQPYIWSIVEDISKHKQAEERMSIAASVFAASPEGIVISDADNHIVDVNPAFTRITGYSREEALGRNPSLLSSGRHDRAFYAAMWQALERDGAWRSEIWNRRKNGEVYAELLSISAIRDANGKVQRYVALFSDISYLKEHEAELNRVANYDALTGLPNRRLLADRMKQAIARTARARDMLAVCYLDLDGFKEVNDTLGHEAGDRVLVEMAQRIGSVLRGGDTVARLGGDEFVVLLQGLEKGEECVATLDRLLAEIARPVAVNGKPLVLGASIGVSIYPLDDEDPDTLLRHADQAMYAAKQSGKNRYHIYDPALDLRARSHHEFLKSVRRALEQGQFELYYQPKIDLRTRTLAGAEALIRWRHPERGLLLPAEFLPAIGNTELDIEIGNWVIAAALGQIGRWREAGLDIEVSINISAHHLKSAGFTEALRRQLAHYPDLPPGRLQIEVLETTALEDITIVREIIGVCRKLGMRFALDDFGMGYASLSYLSNLPVDVLKIDQTLVRDMLGDKGHMAIVQSIIALAGTFGRETVAEGIETEEYCRALLELGCEKGQGYYIARPMPAHELTTWKTTI